MATAGKGNSFISTLPVIRNEEWDRVLEMAGYNIVHLRDKRYDCVLHLVTAAIGTWPSSVPCTSSCLLIVFI